MLLIHDKDIMKYLQLLSITLILSLFSWSTFSLPSISILNVSYDTTREFYEVYNRLFAKLWQEKTSQIVTIEQSHGGSGAQARAVIEGLNADVVSLALAYDIDLIASVAHLLPPNWQTQFPHQSCPYTSTLLFLVRAGNPKQIKDWSDLIRNDVQVIIGNPKTSGGARWSYLAAWGYAEKKYNKNEQAVRQFMTLLYQHVPILDISARAAANTFVQRGQGDVLVTWENEAYLVLTKMGSEQYQIIRPSLSIVAEPPVALLIKNTEQKGTTAVAKAYLATLFTPTAQELAAKFFFRPTNKLILAKYNRLFPPMNLITIQDLGGWQRVQHIHFDKGGFFDQIYQKD